MRYTWLLLGMTLMGCAASSGSRSARLPDRPLYADATASGLVFDPQIVAEEGRSELPRDERAAGVFLGFDDVTATFFSIRTDDQQNDLFGDRFSRRAVYEKVGVNYR